MTYIHEIIDFGSQIPVKFFIHGIGNVPRHWHQSAELLFVLKGPVTLQVKDHIDQLNEEDIVLINPYDIHSLSAQNAVLAAFQIKLSMFDKQIDDFGKYRFDCNSAADKDKSRFIPLKRLLARMIQLNAGNDPYREVQNKALAYSLLHELLTTFGNLSKDGTLDISSQSFMKRMNDILDYMNQNFTRPLSLSSVAENFFISSAYLSRIFKKYVGINFYDYLTAIRLNHGENLLSSTDQSIEKISEMSGFANSRSFVTAFRREYGMVPSKYRQKNTRPWAAPAINSGGISNYFDFEPGTQLTLLAHSLSGQMPSASVKAPAELQSITVNLSGHGTPLLHTWKRMTSIGRASLLLYEDTRNLLRKIQREIGFEYIKFHGIFDDDMMVLSRDPQNNPIFSFTYTDKILDFLISVRLKPLIQLSFMPSALAAPGGHYIFEGKSLIALPCSWELWDQLIHAFVSHCIRRYGIAQVLTWPFCVWNEPHTSAGMFGFEKMSDYFKLYLHSYKTVKALDSRFIFGTSSYTSEAVADDQATRDFIKFSTENNCIPDFVNFHFYPMEADYAQKDMQGQPRLIYKSSPDTLRDMITSLKETMIYKSLAGRLHFQDSRIECPGFWLTEWNSTVSHKDWLNDTAFKGAYVAKNILENYDRLECFDYWSASDLIEENPLPSRLFHGGLGLFTYNQIPKPPYLIMQLLSDLGSRLIQRGPGYFITRMNDSFVIILYNYQHYSRLYTMGELFDMTYTDRYTAFPDEKEHKITLTLNGLEHISYRRTDRWVNKEHGSCFDQWLAFGALPLSPEDTRLLASLSVPMLSTVLLTPDEGQLHFSVTLKPHEVRQIRLVPQRPEPDFSPLPLSDQY